MQNYDIPQKYKDKKLVKSWLYNDNILVARYENHNGDKEVLPWIKKNDEWVNKAPSVPYPIYNYFNLDMCANKKAVYIVEGEKCASALISLGLNATTSLGGANAALKSDWSIISKFENIYILLDNDEPGYRYAHDLAMKLFSLGSSPENIYLIYLPDLAESEDVVDWIKKELPYWDEYSKIPEESIKCIRDILVPIIKENARSSIELWEDLPTNINIQLPEFNVKLLPELLQEYAESLANEFEVSHSLVALGILSIISAAANKRFVITPKNNWEEPINTYTVIALPPANNKSSILKNLIKPIIDWEQEQALILGPKIKLQTSEYKTKHMKIDKIRKDMIKVNKPEQIITLKTELEQLEQSLVLPGVLPQIFVNDTTPEALSTTIFEQSGKGAIISDEGGIMETLSGLYSSGRANVDILLKGIDGGSVRIKRKDRSLDLNPYLSILMLVQPEILKNIQEKSSFKGNGFLERFLYLIPESKVGKRTLSSLEVPEELKLRYNQIIKNILNLEDSDAPIKLSLSEDAQDEFMTFRLYIEKELGSEGSLHEYREWGGKICGYTLRIAGQLHITEYLTTHKVIISLKTIKNAIEIIKNLIPHTKYVYGLKGKNQIETDAHTILEWIKISGIRQFTKTEVVNKFKNRSIHKSNRLDKGLNFLCENHFIKQIKDLSTKKPTEIFIVNPKL